MFYCCCSVFFRDCKDCKVVVACQQFRCVCLPVIKISNACMKIFCCSSLYPVVMHSFSSNTCSECLCGAACKNEKGVKFTPRSTIFWWVTMTNYNLFYFLELVIVRRWTSFYVVLLNPLLSLQVEWNLLAISIFTLNLKVRKLSLGWTGQLKYQYTDMILDSHHQHSNYYFYVTCPWYVQVLCLWLL